MTAFHGLRPVARWMRLPVIALLLGITSSLPAQTPSAAPATQPSTPTTPPAPPSLQQRLGDLIDQVRIDHATARQSLDWWSKTTGIPLRISWTAMEQEGVSPDNPITMSLHRVPVGVVLAAILQQTSPDLPLMFQVTPWDVLIQTRNMANRETVVRVYDITDLLIDVPDRGSTMNFNLSSAISSSTVTGPGGSGRSTTGASLFSSGGNAPAGSALRRDRGEELADIIRQTIEPDIWIENGGQHSSIRVFSGRLIVRAPLYVQQQIAKQSVTTTRPPRGEPKPRTTPAAAPSTTSTPKPSDISGIQQPDGQVPVSGKREY
ncbi:MAG: hypothetical protein IT440_13240 [Phycisphaeraceae bacterium]|nr:hypothetical protein [Phycisphaeraceae bacterium]